MNTLLARLQKHLVWSIPSAMLLGLGLGSLADARALRWLILPLTFLMIYPMMVTMSLRALATPGGKRLQATALVINFGVMPGIGWALGLLFFAEQPAARLALLLTALLPTSGMTISWTGLSKGNVPAAVKMTVVGLIVGSLLAPLYLKALLGAVVEIPILQVALQIVLIVFLPMVTGYIMTHHLFFRYEVLFSLHMLAVDLLLIWIPLSRISHFMFYFFSKAIHGAEFGKRAVTP